MTKNIKLKISGLLASVSIMMPLSAQAADQIAMPAPAVMSPAKTPAFYFRGEIGGAWIGENRGYWWGPGGPPADPRITFDLNTNPALTGNIAVGAEVMPGVRADLSLGYTGSSSVDANWISASDGSAGPHADIDTSVSAVNGMVNLFVEPLSMSGNNGPIQPFVTAGIGFAQVKMDEWTRTNAAVAQPVRRWSGNSTTNFAWTIGAGISADIENVMKRPAFLDVTYRYTDFGNVSGGMTPTFPGPPPNNSPTEPFNFDYTTHSVMVGLRVPFGSR